MKRMPQVIVPNSMMNINMKDNDGNTVFRIVVYTPQLEDVIKACRRNGYNAREFVYN